MTNLNDLALLYWVEETGERGVMASETGLAVRAHLKENGDG